MTHNLWLRTISKRISLIVDIKSIPFFWMRRFPALFIVSGCKFNRDKIRIRSDRCQSCWIATNSFYQFILRIWINRFVNWKNLIFITISSLFVIENSNFIQENFDFFTFPRFSNGSRIFLRLISFEPVPWLQANLPNAILIIFIWRRERRTVNGSIWLVKNATTFFIICQILTHETIIGNIIIRMKF